jgi:hypothetical protein
VRIQAKLKLGHYPLAAAEARRIRNYLRFSTEPASVLDPCAGTGAALYMLTEAATVRRYGIELDAYRAVEARKVLDEVVQGSAFDTNAYVESFSLIYVNAPYDFEIGAGKNRRMERLCSVQIYVVLAFGATAGRRCGAAEHHITIAAKARAGTS